MANIQSGAYSSDDPSSDFGVLGAPEGDAEADADDEYLTPEGEQAKDDLDDLEDLITESVEAAKANPLINLHDLLIESVGLTRDEAAAKASRDRLKRGGQSAREAKEDAERLALWEQRHEWMQVASVAMFDHFDCACGEHRSVFNGLFIREDRKTGTGVRWRRVSGLDEGKGLQREVAAREHHTSMCAACATEQGWDLSKAYAMEG